MPSNRKNWFWGGFLAVSAAWLAIAAWMMVQQDSGIARRGDSASDAGLVAKAAPKVTVRPAAVVQAPSAEAAARVPRAADAAGAATLRALNHRVRAERLREGVLLAYGPLAVRLSLDDATRAALLELLARERTAAGDALQAAQAAGIRSGEGAIAAVEQAIEADRLEMRRLLGGEGFAQLEAYEQKLPETLTLERLAPALPGDAALSGEQASQLTDAIYQREPPAFNAHPAFTAAIGLKDAPLSQSMLTAAAAFLTPPQREALETIASDQRERAELQRAWTAATSRPTP